jgi:hypothetical protein
MSECMANIKQNVRIYLRQSCKIRLKMCLILNVADILMFFRQSTRHIVRHSIRIYPAYFVRFYATLYFHICYDL